MVDLISRISLGFHSLSTSASAQWRRRATKIGSPRQMNWCVRCSLWAWPTSAVTCSSDEGWLSQDAAKAELKNDRVGSGFSTVSAKRETNRADAWQCKPPANLKSDGTWGRFLRLQGLVLLQRLSWIPSDPGISSI